MSMKDRIEARLRQGLEPVLLEVIDDSHRHAGHAGARPGGETHYSVHVVSERFVGKSKVERHRMTYALLGDEFAASLHALALRAQAPGEA